MVRCTETACRSPGWYPVCDGYLEVACRQIVGYFYKEKTILRYIIICNMRLTSSIVVSSNNDGGERMENMRTTLWQIMIRTNSYSENIECVHLVLDKFLSFKMIILKQGGMELSAV